MTLATSRRGAAWLLLVALPLAGCAKQEYAMGEAAADASMLASPEGAFLAYEHRVQLQLPGEQIAPRLQAVSAACQSGRFGDCAVLQLSQGGGDTASGSIEMRIAPQGVEPIIALAGEKGEVTRRTTQAEDLARQVADTRLTQTRLQNEHQRLLEYQQRKDLAVADLLTLSQRLSEIEAGLEQANRDAAQQRRRIDTQKLTLQLESTSSQRNRSEIGRALGEFGDIFTTSLAWLIRLFAGLLPVALVGGGVVWGAVKLWRRNRKRPASTNG